MALRKNELLPQDPFAALRHLTSDFDRFFEASAWPAFRWPVLKARLTGEAANWIPEIDVFERDNHLVTKIDLPGLKKEDVKVEVTDGHLVISGERKTEVEDRKENFYRCEREYGRFSRVVPLPRGVTFEDVKATFADGVLEVSVALPVKAEPNVRKVEIEEAKTAA